MIYKVGKRITSDNWQKITNDLQEILNNGDDVIIDFKDTEYISSAGIRVLIMFLKQFRAKGYDFSIINPSDSIKEIFVITGLDNLFLLTDKDKKNLQKK
ncbi:MAG: STAS domain-containing protein [Bacilli bacterium]|nr:STAS domain-containing protein [Bacilli bacterium]